jgi:hypothetical protein
MDPKDNALYNNVMLFVLQYNTDYFQTACLFKYPRKQIGCFDIIPNILFVNVPGLSEIHMT